MKVGTTRGVKRPKVGTTRGVKGRKWVQRGEWISRESGYNAGSKVGTTRGVSGYSAGSSVSTLLICGNPAIPPRAT